MLLEAIRLFSRPGNHVIQGQEIILSEQEDRHVPGQKTEVLKAVQSQKTIFSEDKRSGCSRLGGPRYSQPVDHAVRSQEVMLFEDRILLFDSSRLSSKIRELEFKVRRSCCLGKKTTIPDLETTLFGARRPCCSRPGDCVI